MKILLIEIVQCLRQVLKLLNTNKSRLKILIDLILLIGLKSILHKQTCDDIFQINLFLLNGICYMF